MLEGVLHEDDQDERWYLIAVEMLVDMVENLHAVGIAQPQQVDVAADELSLLDQRDRGVAVVVEYEAQQPAQLHDTRLGFVSVQADERMDVVERVHQEMRIDLIAQILQLVVEFLLSELCQLLVALIIVEIELHTDVGSHDEHHHGHTEDVAFGGVDRGMLR